MSTTVKLETCAALYAAAQEQLTAALRGVDRVVTSAAAHGFTESQLIEATQPNGEGQGRPAPDDLTKSNGPSAGRSL